MRAIDTEYNGYLFRSRLEARWAVFFDTLDVSYEYELEGFDLGDLGYYLPDFWFADWNCWGEVKPSRFTLEEYRKAEALDNSCLLLEGMPEVTRGYYLTSPGAPAWESSYERYVSGKTWGRVVLSYSAYKGRLWFLFGESVNSYTLDESPEVAAKQARFEHGQVGSPNRWKKNQSQL